MAILVDLNPQTEARLVAEAHAHGMQLEAYAGKILQEYAPDYATGTGVLTVADLEALSRELSRYSENLPVLPLEVNNRESYYEDRW